jgi:hypothetical protein
VLNVVELHCANPAVQIDKFCDMPDADARIAKQADRYQSTGLFAAKTVFSAQQEIQYKFGVI